MEVAARIALVVAGVLVVVMVFDAALRTFVLPRAAPVRLTRAIAGAVRRAFAIFARAGHSYEHRDRVMALYGPMTLLALQAVWLLLILAGFTAVFRGAADPSWSTAFQWSGSALFTLGFATSDDAAVDAIVFAEAAIGLTLLALLISYLPTIYGAFSRREIAVTRLSVRAGTPPTPTELLTRAHRAGFTDRLDELWEEWERWFVEIEETHTSLVILNFFRSPNPHRSWVTAAGAVLDSAAIRASVLHVPHTPSAAVCIRAGFNALRAIADYFRIEYDPDPTPDDPISVSRTEFFEVYEALGSVGVPVRPDREKAWRDFVGWRVNYDSVLLALANMTMAPYAPWISDRSALRPVARALR